MHTMDLRTFESQRRQHCNNTIPRRIVTADEIRTLVMNDIKQRANGLSRQQLWNCNKKMEYIAEVCFIQVSLEYCMV